MDAYAMLDFDTMLSPVQAPSVPLLSASGSSHDYAYALTPVHIVAIPPVKSVHAPPFPSRILPVWNPASCTLRCQPAINLSWN